MRLGIGDPVKTSQNLGPRKVIKVHTDASRWQQAIDSLDGRIQQVKDSLLSTEHSHRLKWPVLKTCEWRLELRAKRPAQELFRDTVQTALENEKKVLQEARQALIEITARLRSGPGGMGELSELRRRFCRDPTLHGEVHAPPQARAAPSGPSSLAAGGDPLAEVTQLLPPMPSSPTGCMEFMSKEQMMKQVISSGAKAIHLAKEADGIVVKVEDKCSEAHAQVLAAFAKRGKQTGEMRMNLEEQLAETNNTIDKAERAIFGLRSNVKGIADTIRRLQAEQAAASSALVQLVEHQKKLLGQLAQAKELPKSMQDAPSSAPTGTQLAQQSEAVKGTAQKNIQEALKSRDKGELQAAIEDAERAQLNPREYAEAQRVLREETVKAELAENKAAIAQKERALAQGAKSIETSQASGGQTTAAVLEKIAATEAMLEKMRETRHAVEEDLRCKLASYKIDDTCRRMAPHVTPAHKKPVHTDFGRLVRNMSALDF